MVDASLLYQIGLVFSLVCSTAIIVPLAMLVH